MSANEGVVNEDVGAAELREDEEGVRERGGGGGGEGEEGEELGDEEALPVEAGD